MHLDPSEDMYTQFILRYVQREGNCFHFWVSEAHFTRAVLPVHDKCFWLAELLIRYLPSLPERITARLLLALNMEPRTVAAPEQEYQAFVQKHPHIPAYIKWYGCCFGQWRRCTAAQYAALLRMPHPKSLFNNRVQVYGMHTFTYQGETYYTYQTFEQIDRYAELANYMIYSLSTSAQGHDRETNKNYAVVKLSLAPELLFLVEGYAVGEVWRTERGLWTEEEETEE